MLNSRWTSLLDVVTHRAGILTTLILIGSVCTAPPAVAVEMTSLYTAQVALDENARDSRADAYEAALIEVLLRVSGSELGSDKARIELLFPKPESYVVKLRPGDDSTLWVSFDGKAIEASLREAGETVWGGDRPLTLIWLAVDWGRGVREIVAAEESRAFAGRGRPMDRNRMLRERVLEAAERRGLPVAFPLMDSEDLQKVSFSDIWGGFDEHTLEASKRYEVDSVLVGRIRPTSSQRNRWRYHFGGAESSWSGEAEDVINQVGDLLAAEFAISGSSPLESVHLDIGGIDSVAAYGAVQNLLAKMSVIEDFAIIEVNGDRISYRVEAHGGAARLRRALRFNGMIEQNGFDRGRFAVDNTDGSDALVGSKVLHESLLFFYTTE